MHRPGESEGVGVMALLQLGEQGVLKKAPRWQHGQAPGLVDHHQVAVIEQGARQHRHGRLLPGGPMPHELIPGLDQAIGPELLAVAPDLAGGKPLQPHPMV